MKKIKRRKRHIVTELLGNILTVVVHAANLHDTMQGGKVFQKASSEYRAFWVFARTRAIGKIFEKAVKSLGLKIEISERINHKFEMLPKRWRVERTFLWLNNYRRLSKDCEITTTSEASYVEISSIALLLRRLFKA
ncbi:MAG: hypothetical protein LBM75_10455 [Myxococcales bacterium]|jgi:putative transposase|nr:hypothetical protein [Myxococcales bacterium]